MATKTDFTADEWNALHRGATGSGLLVSMSDRHFSETFGEASALSKYVAGQRLAASSPLIRELAAAGGTGFGLTTSPDKLRDETLSAIAAGLAALQAKSPDDVEPYRQFVLGIADAVAAAKGGVTKVETEMVDQIRRALGVPGSG